MDQEKIKLALHTFSNNLPERPEWTILMKASGEFIARIGEYPYFYPQAIEDFTAAQWTHAHGIHLLNTLDHLNHGGLDFSVTFGGNRIFCLFHLNYAYFLGITFNGLKSLDTMINAIQFHTIDILEAINPTHPTTPSQPASS
ncbi:MAG: hypothetical protein ABI690_27745 [Chloroflexota bacterium]